MKIPARDHDGQFDNFQQWIAKAASWIGGTNPVCFDAKDRHCPSGKEFMRARDEGAFPVRFWRGEGMQTKKQQRESIKNREAIMRFNSPWRYK